MKQLNIYKPANKLRRAIYSTAGLLLLCTIMSGIVLSSTTTHAVTKSSTATVNVTLSCTMSTSPGTGGTATTDGYSYSATIDPGQYAEINGTIMTTTCTGTGNYSLYAIGNSGNTFDTPTNTQLISSNPSVANIPTGTATSGNTSNWAFKLATSGSYSPTIINPYNNYASIPGDDYAKIATYIPGTTGSAATSSVQAKYRVYITSTQPAGNYTGKVKYTMVYPNDAPAPENPATCSTPVPDVTFMQELADSTKKTAALSSMTQGSQYYLIDERDNRSYCVSKQSDGNIWMTQNLDLDIGGSGVATLTSENTDLNTSGSAPYVDGYSTSGGVITWTPASTAYPSGRVINGTSVTGWSDNNSAPYSAEGGDRYYITSGTTSDETAQTLAQCAAVSGRSKELCAHYHVGNYYNWNAAIASNNSGSYNPEKYAVASNSICPKGWKIPQGQTSSADASTWQFANLWWRGGAIKSLETYTFSAEGYTTDGFNIIRTSPLFFVRAGDISGNVLNSGGSSANYWTSTVWNYSFSTFAGFGGGHVLPTAGASYQRSDGQTIRCMVR